MTSSRRRTIVALAVTLTAGALITTPATAQATAAAPDPQASLAAGLLNRDARQQDEPLRIDPTRLTERLLAFAAAGDTGVSAYPGRAQYLLDALETRASFADGSTTLSPVSVSGRPEPAVTSFDEVARTTYIAEIYGKDGHAFAGRDLLAALPGYVVGGAGTDAGWFKTTTAGNAKVDVASQARGVLALASGTAAVAAGNGAAALRSVQLGNGSFASIFTGTSGDVGTSAWAIEALVAEDSPASVDAAGKAAEWLVTQQADDGGFGEITPEVVGLAANALRAGGQADAADAARSYLEDLQVTAGDDLDPLYVGAFASNAGQRDSLLAGNFDPLTFPELVNNAEGGVLALTDASLGELDIDVVAGQPPAVEGQDTFSDGPCTGDEGVNVVIDFAYIAPVGQEEPLVRCALGTQASGWAAIANAGFEIGSVPGFVGGAICELEGVPAQGYPYCWTEEGYWSYWHAAPGAAWQYSNFGAAGRAPAAGSSEGWTFVPLSGAGFPPGAGPTFVPGVDTTAPVVSFTSLPDNPVTDGSAVPFSFYLDDTGASVDCRLDSAAWAPCDRPTTWDASSWLHTLHDVSEGTHVFEVRASDSWDNATVIEHEFTVDDPNIPNPPETLPAKKLTVSVNASIVLRGTSIKVSARGLEPREAYTVRMAGTTLASGKASAAGSMSRAVTVPKSLGQAKRVLKLVGSQPNRMGETSVWTAAPKKLAVAKARNHVKQGMNQRVIVRGLIPGEKVVVRDAGKTLTRKADVANARGIFRVTFGVGNAKGAKVVKAFGFKAVRHGTTTFRVTRR